MNGVCVVINLHFPDDFLNDSDTKTETQTQSIYFN